MWTRVPLTELHSFGRSIFPPIHKRSFVTRRCPRAGLKNCRAKRKISAIFYSFQQKKTNHGFFFFLGEDFRRSGHAYDAAARVPIIWSNWDVAHVIKMVPTASIQERRADWDMTNTKVGDGKGPHYCILCQPSNNSRILREKYIKSVST